MTCSSLLLRLLLHLFSPRLLRARPSLDRALAQLYVHLVEFSSPRVDLTPQIRRLDSLALSSRRSFLERPLTQLYVHLAEFPSPCHGVDLTPQTRRPNSQVPSSRAPLPRSALAPQVRLSSAAMRLSILHASTVTSSYATVTPVKHATKAPMARALSEGASPARCRGYKIRHRIIVESFVLSQG
jgi:hypothetical protein